MSPHGSGPFTRRQFLSRNALGVGSVALAWLLREDRLLGTPPTSPAAPNPLTCGNATPFALRGPAP